MTALALASAPTPYSAPPSNMHHSGVETLAREIEGYFLKTGQQLEESTQALDVLNAHFDALAQAIDHVATGQANQTLDALAQTIRTSHDQTSHRHKTSLQTLKAMMGCVGSTQSSVSNIEKSTRIIIALVVNARIASVNLGAAEDDFRNFAAEIRRSIDVSNKNIDELGDELALVLRCLHAAFEAQAQVFQRWDAIAQSLPDRLHYNLSQMADRREQLTRAAYSVGQTAQRLGQNIGTAIVALQSGDSVRQRMEHVVQALALKSGDAAEQCVLYKLQAAQLEDMAALLDKELQDLGQALVELAQDAKTIAQAGLGSLRLNNNKSSNSFLNNIAQDIAQVEIILRDLATAEAHALRNIQQVVASARQLERSIRVVQSFDVNMRVMALNANLKASRLGDKGRALTSIAVSLRQCSKSTALDAAQAMQLIKELTTLANERQALHLTAESASALHTHTPGEITTAAQELQNASAHVDTLLETLSIYSENVAKLILESQAQISKQSHTAEQLRSVAQSLLTQAQTLHPAPVDLEAYAHEPCIVACEHLYTMSRERAVHAQLFGLHEAKALQQNALPTNSIDDCLF